MRDRCPWCGTDPLYVAYHDEEWGVPVHDDRQLFELLILEGAQAGLSWITVLRKRDAYREAFAAFDIARVAGFTAEDDRATARQPGDRPQPPEGARRDPYCAGRPGSPGATRLPRRVPVEASSAASHASIIGVDGRRPAADARGAGDEQGAARRWAPPSSVRPSVTPSCRPPAWSTTTCDTCWKRTGGR